MHNQSSDDRKLGNVFGGVKDATSAVQVLPSNTSTSRVISSQQKSIPESQQSALLASGSVPLGTSLRFLFIYMQIFIYICIFIYVYIFMCKVRIVITVCV